MQRDHLSGDSVWVVECSKVVEYGLYFKGRIAGIHDILAMGCEKMRIRGILSVCFMLR